MRRLLLLLSVGCAASLQAQTLELRLRDSTTRAPIVGAIVRLLRNDSVVTQALTSEVGTATLRAGAAGRAGYVGRGVGPAAGVLDGLCRAGPR